MVLYKYRYALFFSFLLAEVLTWLVTLLPAGIFFDAVPDFVFTIFMVLHFGSPLICILYWIGLRYKYRRTAFMRADALAFSVSVVVFLLKLLLIVFLLAELAGAI